jgi:para-nitrobenzyl esterase
MQDKLAGAPHASEIPYVFNTLAEARWPMAARDQRLADAMTDYWVAFAKTGAPQAPGRPAWPLADGVHIMAFTDNGAEPGVDDRTERLTALGRIADPHS